MKKTMEWTDPVIIRLSENRGASGAATCAYGDQVGSGQCFSGGATDGVPVCSTGDGASSCETGAVAGASGTVCDSGGGGDL